MQLQINGEAKIFENLATVSDLVEELKLDPRKVAVEVNLAIVPRSLYGDSALCDGDRIEIVQFIGGRLMQDDPLIIAGRRFTSRLLVGTGKYKDWEQTRAATEASGAEIVTVALRRANLSGGRQIQDVLDPKRYTYLPNSAGCYTAAEAVRTLKLAREAGSGALVKLEVIGDAKTLFPDVAQTLEAAAILVKDGFEVMAYTDDDADAAKELERLGCVAVMPLAAPIGSGLGVQNPRAILKIIEQAGVPILVDAGVGTASDAAIAMELGCDGVLMNTAIAEAKDPVMMAAAMKQAVIAGRLAFKAGRMPRRQRASASSPAHDFLKNY